MQEYWPRGGRGGQPHRRLPPGGLRNGVGGSQASAASNWIWGSVLSDDAYKGSEPSDFTQINDAEDYQWSTSQVDGHPERQVACDVRGREPHQRNAQPSQEGRGGLAERSVRRDQAGIEGEAKFLRAHYMFEAYKMWGNVPYLREDDTDLRKASIAKAAVATEILADLDAAIAKLPATPRKGQVGRATQWTAKAYKGSCRCTWAVCRRAHDAA